MVRRFTVAAAAIAFVAGAVLGGVPVQASEQAALPHAATPIVPNGSWTTYHHDDGHTGFDASAPVATNVVATAGWTMPTLDEQVYASPLILNGVVYVATLNDTVYALNQIDGSVIWSKNLGAPQPANCNNNTPCWGCGNISSTGILGTPVIDAAANRLYAVAGVVNASNGTDFRLFGLDLGNSGTVVLNTNLTTGGFDWTIEQERGALALHGGFVYVPFGGRAGDCGAYHGYVFSVGTGNGAIDGVYQTPGDGAGFWSGGGVVVDDATGNVFETSGNGVASGCDANAFGAPQFENDAVVRLAAGSLAHQDSFVPQDWQGDWCSNDQDLGSASPVLLGPNLLFQGGKWGTGFLLDPNNLGGLDGQRFPTPQPAAYAEANICFGNHSDATFASFAYAAPFVYVECEGHGIVALNVNTATPSFSPCDTCAAPDWNAGGTATFGPPIVAGGAVWAATSGGGMYAFNATTGAQIFHSSAGFGINRFVTPAEAGGQVIVPAGDVVRSFSFGGNVSLTPGHLDFGGAAPTTTTGAQIVTLHNNTTSSVTVSAVATTGANSADYVKGSDNCTGATVLAGGTCTVQVSFHPAGFGGLPAAITFTDTGPNSPQSVPLYGEGALDDSGHMYTLDGYGGLHADGGSPAMTASSYWGGWNIARSVAVFPDGTGGYVLDGYGGLHPFGSATTLSGYDYWSGWDIARQVVLAPWSSAASPAGWTLDGWGGLHPFGGAPGLTGVTYWRGWDIARGVVILPDSTPSSVAGYTLDGWGGVHPFGGAPAISNATYWQGWDIARSLALSPNSSKTNGAGWVIDGYGGVHAFGNAPSLAGSFYSGGHDIARGIVAWTGNGPSTGGWVMDGYGGIHPFGSAPAVTPGSTWPGWDIATSFGSSGGNSGSRRRT